MPVPTVDFFELPFGAPYGSPFGVQDWAHKTPHRGTDFIQPVGAKVHSAANGKCTVIPIANSKVLGNVVVVATKLKNGRVVYLGYCHLSRILVKNGQTVKRGQPIGEVGNTGTASQGAHLHLTASYESAGVFYGNVFDAKAFIDTHDSLPRSLRVHK